jgi:hypothetical protein
MAKLRPIWSHCLRFYLNEFAGTIQSKNSFFNSATERPNLVVAHGKVSQNKNIATKIVFCKRASLVAQRRDVKFKLFVYLQMGTEAAK